MEINECFQIKTEIKGAFTEHITERQKCQKSQRTKEFQKEANGDKDQHTERKHRGGRLNRFTARAGSLFEAVLPIFAMLSRLFEVLLLPCRVSFSHASNVSRLHRETLQLAASSPTTPRLITRYCCSSDRLIGNRYEFSECSHLRGNQR